MNLLDTPGHADFSEDTYRTLTAVDAALMVIDAAKGVEERTVKLMEVCRLRDTPIVTFVNKLDRDGREPLELLDEIERVLRIRRAPVTWPIGMGRELQGIYHILNDTVHLYAPNADHRWSGAGCCTASTTRCSTRPSGPTPRSCASRWSSCGARATPSTSRPIDRAP